MVKNEYLLCLDQVYVINIFYFSMGRRVDEAWSLFVMEVIFLLSLKGFNQLKQSFDLEDLDRL
jgi:hypothetical protein